VGFEPGTLALIANTLTNFAEMTDKNDSRQGVLPVKKKLTRAPEPSLYDPEWWTNEETFMYSFISQTSTQVPHRCISNIGLNIAQESKCGTTEQNYPAQYR